MGRRGRRDRAAAKAAAATSRTLSTASSAKPKQQGMHYKLNSNIGGKTKPGRKYTYLPAYLPACVFF